MSERGGGGRTASSCVFVQAVVLLGLNWYCHVLNVEYVEEPKLHAKRFIFHVFRIEASAVMGRGPTAFAHLHASTRSLDRVVPEASE